jgi:hypothetical protein
VIGSALSNTGLPSAVAAHVRGFGCAALIGKPIASTRVDSHAKCADGSSGSVFSSSVPDVSLFDAGYRAQRSVRSNVNWSGAVIGNRFLAGVDATYSMNLNQTGIENLNFDPSVRFRLSTEANRPIFARASSIVGSTGSVAPSDARLNASFGNVLEQRSDLSSRNASSP